MIDFEGRPLAHLSPSERENWLEDFSSHPTRGRVLSRDQFEIYIRNEAKSFVELDEDSDSDNGDEHASACTNCCVVIHIEFYVTMHVCLWSISQQSSRSREHR